MKKTIFIFLTFLLFQTIFAQATLYVSLTGSNSPPYSTLASGANSIQTAVNAASNGDLILVNDGTYVLTTNITVTKGITIKSINGKSLVSVDGNHVTRCFYVNHVDAVIDDITITNGYNPSSFGGGVNIVNGGTVQNCIIGNNQARDGGGVAIDNSGLVLNCVIANNLASDNGSSGYGGGVRMLNGGTTRGCLIHSNTSVNYGGGINIWSSGTIQNCTITNNTAPNGAGVRTKDSSLMENTISYYNTGLDVQVANAGSVFNNNCTSNALIGTGNITDNPYTGTDLTLNPFDLPYGSACIDAGLNQPWMGSAFDLDGNARIFNGTVDIGAYEFSLTAPTIPVLVSPSNFAIGESIEPNFSWNAVSGAASYTLQVASDASFTTDVQTFSGITATNYIVTGLSNSTQYFWHVSATNLLGTSNYSAAYNFITTSAAIPNLTHPINGAFVYTHSPNLYWYGSCTTYDLLYSVNADMSGAIVINNINAINKTITGLADGTTYFWQVRSRTSTGAISAYSVIQNFKTLPVAVTTVIPTPSWPIGNPIVYTNSPFLYWYLGADGTGLTYDIEYSTGVLTGNATVSSIATTFYELSGLASGTTYNWQVRSRDGAITSDWSVQASFTIAGTIGELTIPIPSWPIGNSTVYTNSPILYWYLGTVGTGLKYDIEYSTGVLTGTATVSNITTSFYALSGLESGATYNWQVRSRDGAITSDWSVQESFTTLGTNNAPIIPIPSWPIGGAAVYTDSPILYWYLGAVGNGLTYEVEYSTGAFSGTPNVTNITSLYTTLSGLINGETYNWQVRSRDGLIASDWSVQESFVVNVSTAGAAIPIPSWPIGGTTVYTETPKLYWYLNSGSTGLEYEVLYSPSAVTVGGVLQNATSTSAWSTDAFFTMPALVPGGIYYWQVRSRLASNHALVSNYSSVESFVLNACCSTPIILIPGSPNCDVTLQTDSPTLSWILPITSETELNYEVEISLNKDMSNSEVYTNLKNPYYTLSGLSGGAKYYWRARSINDDGLYSQYSDLGTFNIDNNITGLKNESIIPSEFIVEQNYPNPFNPSTMVKYGLPEPSNVKIEIFNMLGQSVGILVNQEKSAGYYETTWNASNLPSGIYLISLRADGLSYNKNFTQVRKALLLK
ncbi:MAG: T9SS type A sorting domain-containing protein [Bacteroidetes bacterium]|nr:T9SS type A sorting domain-containing protein [Bacteroidota bacterium]MBU1115696.1 T9SS type A sorting domain-containing protein [Bacteroidota bacterium]MBU1799947.1 T9SS type A sorting domain-containing protein [Bacteroidota bacterium]